MGWLTTQRHCFIRIRKALLDYPEIDFDIKEFAGGVMVTFAQRVGVNDLLVYIQANPGKRSGEISITFKLNRRTIECWPKQLKENGSGRI